MRIAIDAKWFFSGNPSGRVVVFNLLKHLIAQNKKHQIFVFLKKTEKKLDFPFPDSNVKLIYIWGVVNQISNLFIIPFYLRKYKIDVALCFYFSPIFTKTKTITFVFDAIFKSNPEYFTFKERLYFSPIKYLAMHSDLILTISRTEKERLIRYGIGNTNNVEVIYMGVDAKYKPLCAQNPNHVCTVKEKYGLPERFLLYVGRINTRKNIPNLLYSIKLLKDKELKLVIGGKSDRKSFNLSAILKDYNIEDRVITTGFIDDNDLPIIYSLAHVFCYVSFDEGFGLPPLESLASGVPVVIANTGSLPEVCNRAGTYCFPLDPNDIAYKIDFLLNNENVYKEKQQLGIEVAKRFSWPESSMKLLNVFEKTGNSEQYHLIEKA